MRCAGDIRPQGLVQPLHCIPEKSIVDWLLQVALALEHMHYHNMLHRGVTAENVLLCTPCDSNPARVRLGMGVAAETTRQEPYDCKSGEMTRKM
ncbi:unnamed protein product [Closterium sp. NIES-65]|nr:unnamed protein product [Closterium sp. NIES-65]